MTLLTILTVFGISEVILGENGCKFQVFNKLFKLYSIEFSMNLN